MNIVELMNINVDNLTEKFLQSKLNKNDVL